MHEKFMNIKKLILPTLTVLMLTSQLTGCSTANSKEAMTLLQNNETIEINIPEPENIEQGEQLNFEWTELAYLDNYIELRTTMDDTLLIIPMADGKNGVIYVDSEGNHSNNTCLQDAFNNKKFINNYWNNKETNQRIIQSAKQTFSDLEDESDASCLLAAYNAYYNLLPSYDSNYANLQSTLSRLEAMSLLYRATNPVDDTLQVSTDFTSKVGDNEHSLFAEQIDKLGLTYLTSKNSSLDESTATGTMTRAEYIYMLVNAFYNDEYNTLTSADIKSFSKTTEFTDLQNAGNVAKEQKYIYTEKNPETKQKEEKSYARYQAYELNYCLQNAEDGLTENLFKAYVVANNHGILTDDSETNWELGLTKEYALELLTNVLEETGGKVNFDRGESKGEIIVNNFDSEKTEETEVAGQGGDKSLLDKVETTEDGDNNFYSITEDGRYEVKPDLVALINETSFGAGATVTEIEKFINDNSDLVFFIENDDIEGFMQILETIYTTSGKLSPEQQITTTPSTPSTSTEVANNNTTQSTSGTTSSSNNTSGSTSSSSGSSSSGGSSSGTSNSQLPAGWIPDDQLPPAYSDDETNFTPGTGGWSSDNDAKAPGFTGLDTDIEIN